MMYRDLIGEGKDWASGYGDGDGCGCGYDYGYSSTADFGNGYGCGCGYGNAYGRGYSDGIVKTTENPHCTRLIDGDNIAFIHCQQVMLS